jgi:NADH:ubiquinone oxidoreductase subunit 6 (subunit J)
MDFIYPLLFWLLAAMIGVSAVAMVLTQNIVRAATWLLFTLGGVAGIFFLLGADFVGATQLLVYVGGTLVLVVFGVMLTAQGPFINMRIGAGEWAIAAVVGIGFFAVLAYALFNFTPQFPPEPAQSAAPATAEGGEAESTPPRSLAASIVLGEALLGFKDASPPAPLTGVHNLPAGAALQVGPNVPTTTRPPRLREQMAYLLPFEIVSVHLLVVLIGAAYLARSKRRRGATP